MTAALTPTPSTPMSAIERVVVLGDLSKLTAEERWDYYRGVCQSLKLNPFTRPFQYITLSGRLVLYATKDCTDQLRRLHDVSIDIVSRERIDDIYVVTARATTPNGRHDEEVGAVTIGNLRGDGLANALMKCSTKAKRRVTLSICGLGLLDETEIETIPGDQVRFEDADALHAMPTAATDGPESGRSALEVEYGRLALVAVARGHRDAQRIVSKAAADLDDAVLSASVRALQVWEANLPPEADDDDEAAF